MSFKGGQKSQIQMLDFPAKTLGSSQKKTKRERQKIFLILKDLAKMNKKCFAQKIIY